MFTKPTALPAAALFAIWGSACNQAAPGADGTSPTQVLPPNAGGAPDTGGGTAGDGNTGGDNPGTGTEPAGGGTSGGTTDDSSGTGNGGGADSSTDETDSSDSGSTPDDPLESYFPLADGLTWTYDHIDPLEGTWEEVITVTATEYDGMPAWSIVDSPDRDGNHDIQIWVELENADGYVEVFRVHRDQMLGDEVELSVDYDPGFLRFNHGWKTGDTQTNEYIRRAVDALGIQTNHLRVQEFEVVSTTASAEANGITYENCLQVRRARDDKSKLYWFAKGIGKVRELDEVSGTIEELIEHNVE